jgi:hypothetical protein
VDRAAAVSAPALAALAATWGADPMKPPPASADERGEPS